MKTKFGMWSLVLGICFISCAGGKSCATKQAATDTFIWWNRAEPATIDPGLVRDHPSGNVVYQLFEGLTEYDPKTLAPVPGVATSWDVSADGKTYTFHLRSDAKWSDGTPVTASDFEYSWKRALDPKTASEYAYILYPLLNAEEYNTGKITDSETVGVKAVDDGTLRVELKNPVPYFPHLASFATYRPVHRATVEKWGEEWIRPEHMVSNGPYRLTSWVPQKEIVMEKNPNYWDKANVRINKAIFLPTDDNETALKLYLDGKAHYNDYIPPTKVPEMAKRDDYHFIPEWATYYVWFNTERKPFDDPRVRQALSLAIDRQKIVDVKKSNDVATTQSVPPGYEGYTSPEVQGFDPAKAKALLAEAGFADPKTFPTVSFYYNTSDANKLVAELIQSMWKENLGINIALVNQEWKTLLQTWSTGSFEISRYGWVGDFLDPVTFIDIFTSSSTQNYTRWKNPAFDELVAQSARKLDPATRLATLKKAEEILLQELPAIPLFHYGRPQMIDPRVKGFYPNAMNQHAIKFAWFEQ
ncbi:MAG: peptide ABC transporter substrate-binding protein [Deltaproteobacteria bacterium]|nr:peptide ABC transporter substrate-binding protein [Deltaproteobacteria bacterium]